ncbi:hypothetical protein ACN27G_09850 [Plantactinospora sp. WMMB334]|uniref:hypothetical protein n=1 Tax=Plantactinospora sp. WMMB334 TaxID=3404119 RepID=UPI003B95416E
MSTREVLALAQHYQEIARRSPRESHFWTARALYFGRAVWRHGWEGTVANRPPLEDGRGVGVARRGRGVLPARDLVPVPEGRAAGVPPDLPVRRSR